jgi:hypothetical protein
MNAINNASLRIKFNLSGKQHHYLKLFICNKPKLEMHIYFYLN